MSIGERIAEKATIGLVHEGLVSWKTSVHTNQIIQKAVNQEVAKENTAQKWELHKAGNNPPPFCWDIYCDGYSVIGSGFLTKEHAEAIIAAHNASLGNETPASTDYVANRGILDVWEVIDYDKSQIEIVAPKELHVAFLNNNVTGWCNAKAIVKAHNAALIPSPATQPVISGETKTDEEIAIENADLVGKWAFRNPTAAQTKILQDYFLYAIRESRPAAAARGDT